MTAAHVVQIADKIEVKFPDGETILAKVISSEPLADVAMLKLEKVPEGAVVAELGDSDLMDVGSEVFVVGAPYGLSHTLTVGHISARHKPYTMPSALLGEFFQTDAAINKGNSGGPMFNMKGKVIGIVSHILSKSGGYEGLGFATTSNTAQELLLEKKPFWAGVEGIMLTGKLAKALNLPQSTGMLVQQIADGSPADQVGLRGGVIPITIGNKPMLLGGDILLEIMGVSFSEDGSYLKIKEALHKLPEDGGVTMKVLREGKIKELSGTIER
jgi:S1-C subfamily serine protease